MVGAPGHFYLTIIKKKEKKEMIYYFATGCELVDGHYDVSDQNSSNR